MTILQSFKLYMESLGYTDIYIGGLPVGEDVANNQWGIVASGGNNIIKAQTGEKMKQYLISAYFRSNKAELVDETMFLFETQINEGNCDQLEDFDTIEMEALSFPSDQDLDSEDSTVALCEVAINVYV
jgi:hypothetical protein